MLATVLVECFVLLETLNIFIESFSGINWWWFLVALIRSAWENHALKLSPLFLTVSVPMKNVIPEILSLSNSKSWYGVKLWLAFANLPLWQDVFRSHQLRRTNLSHVRLHRSYKSMNCHCVMWSLLHSKALWYIRLVLVKLSTLWCTYFDSWLWNCVQWAFPTCLKAESWSRLQIPLCPPNYFYQCSPIVCIW